MEEEELAGEGKEGGGVKMHQTGLWVSLYVSRCVY
jgi:hypothetical protein